MNLQVFHTIVANARHFGIISGEMAHCASPKSKKDIDILAVTPEAEKKAKELLDAARGLNSFHKIIPPELTPYWALLTGTSWRIKNPKLRQLQTICAVALGETEESVLQARQFSLSFKCTMDLRFGIWLTTNLWLRWNQVTTGLEEGFAYWDRCPDEVMDAQGAYSGETAKRVSEVMAQDAKFLTELGDFLTSCPALANNRDAAPSDRVYSIEAKSVIDMMLGVSDVFNGLFNP